MSRTYLRKEGWKGVQAGGTDCAKVPGVGRHEVKHGLKEQWVGAERMQQQGG